MVIISTEDIRIRIEMLGGFIIISDGISIREQEKRSSKIWKLLQYLVVNRHRSVSHDELMDVFFDNDFVGNPGSSVRTMIYRARSALSNGGLAFADEIILSSGGGYVWNNAMQCSIDAEEFESLCKKAGAISDTQEQLNLLLEAAELYRGDFLPNSSSELWVMPLTRWYRSLYFNCVHDALKLLSEIGLDDNAEELCMRALRLDPFDETILEYYISSLLAQGKNSEALELYNRTETMFFDELGVSFSDELRSLYKRIQEPCATDELSLEATLKKWLADADFPGAFYCDLSVFKIVYQIEARSTSRSGRTTYIVRIDTKHEPKAKDGGVMKQLNGVIAVTLRKGDLYTRSSPSQYMLMLNKLTYENCKMLCNRILQSLDSKHLAKVINTSIRSITPIV